MRRSVGAARVEERGSGGLLGTTDACGGRLEGEESPPGSKTVRKPSSEEQDVCDSPSSPR